MVTHWATGFTFTQGYRNDETCAIRAQKGHDKITSTVCAMDARICIQVVVSTLTACASIFVFPSMEKVTMIGMQPYLPASVL